MIKCSYFGKLLKQLFIISLISCFGFGVNSFASATLQSTGYGYVGTLGQSFTEGLYTYTIDTKLNFKTELGSLNSDLFYRKTNENDVVYYQSYMWYNGRLHTVIGTNDSITSQGIVDKWCITNRFPGAVNNQINACDSSSDYSYSLNDVLAINPNFTSFFLDNKSMASPSSSPYLRVIRLCFYDGTNYYCVACNPQDPNQNVRCPSGYLTGDEIYFTNNNATFGNLASRVYGRSPFGYSSSTPSSPSESVNSVLTGSYTYSTCSYNELISQLEKYGYNGNLCRGGIDNFYSYYSESHSFAGNGDSYSDWYFYTNGGYISSLTTLGSGYLGIRGESDYTYICDNFTDDSIPCKNGIYLSEGTYFLSTDSNNAYSSVSFDVGISENSPVEPGKGKWIDEIFGQTANGKSLEDWFSFWNSAYVNRFVSSNNLWNDNPAVLRSYFTFYNQFNGSQFPTRKLYEYCLLKKYVSRNSTNGNAVYNGNYFNGECNSAIVNKNSDLLGSGRVIDGVNFNGVGVLSGTEKKSAVEFIQDFFNNIQKLVPEDKSQMGFGVLPAYIITFMLAIIFFRFISH